MYMFACMAVCMYVCNYLCTLRTCICTYLAYLGGLVAMVDLRAEEGVRVHRLGMQRLAKARTETEDALNK